MQKFILIGWNSSETEYWCLIIRKIRASEDLKPLKELLEEFGPCDSMDSIRKEMSLRLGSVTEKETILTQGIVGFHRFLQGYYLTYIKESEAIAKIGSTSG